MTVALICSNCRDINYVANTTRVKKDNFKLSSKDSITNRETSNTKTINIRFSILPILLNKNWKNQNKFFCLHFNIHELILQYSTICIQVP